MSLLGRIFVLMVVCLSMEVATAAAVVEMDLDSVINWKSKEPVTAPNVKKMMQPVDDYRTDTKGDGFAVASWRDFPLNEYQLMVFDGEYLPTGALIVEKNSVVSQFTMTFKMKGKQDGFQEKLEKRVSKELKKKSEILTVSRSDGPAKITRWYLDGWYVSLDLRNDDLTVTLLRQMPGGGPPPSSRPNRGESRGPNGGSEPPAGGNGAPTRGNGLPSGGNGGPMNVGPNATPLDPPSSSPPDGDEAKKIEISVDLDFLLNLEFLWKCTPDDFEKIYRPKREGMQEQPAQFEWLDAERTQARFSSKIALNVAAKMTLFGNVVNVEEAIVEFVNGRAARVIITLYDQAQAGAELALAQFEPMYKLVGKSLGQMLKVIPLNMSETVNSFVKTVSWQWMTPFGIVMLEYNDYKAEGPEGKPEFLRLRLASPEQQAWSLGKAVMGGQ